MKKLLVSLVLWLSMFSTSAHAVPDWIIPSPITIALQVGKWMLLDSAEEEVYYIRVQSRGLTESEARKEAFRLAVDQAVGSLLVTETEIQNDKLKRHDVINYSSGYIHDFNYLNVYQNANGVVLQVDVWVKKSKIAERIALNSKAEGQLQGGRIAEAFKSLQQESKTGDKLLQVVLNDYPHKAWLFNISNIEYVYQKRVPYLIVDFTVWWNEKYIASLLDVMQNIGKKATLLDNSFNIAFNYERCVFCDEPKFLLDQTRAYEMFGSFHSPWPMVQVQLLDIHNQIVHKGCVYYPNLHGESFRRSLWESNGGGVNINADRWVKNKITYNLSDIEINRLDRVQLSFVRKTQCADHY